MDKTKNNTFRKYGCLTAAGITLQMLGSACLFAATLVVIKEINTQVREALMREMSR